MELLPFLVGFVFLAVIVYVFWAAQQRKKAFASEAARLGLSYSGRDEEGLARAHRRLTPMSAGSSPRASNIISGEYRGRGVWCFDFSYTTRQGKHQSTHHRGVALAKVPVAWSPVKIVPETWLHKVGDALGMEDIDFESDEFSRKFWVTSDERKLAYDLLHPRAMEYLLSPGLSHWEIRGGVLCLWSEQRFEAKQVAAVLDRLVGFLELVPAHVLARTAAQVEGPR